MLLLRLSGRQISCFAAIAAVILAAAALMPQIGLAQGTAANAANKAAAQYALESVRRNLQISDARRAALRAEVQALKKDRKALSRASAEAAQAERSYAQEIVAGRQRLQSLTQEKQKQQAVLNRRQTEMAEILAGLEKLGFNPPPAILIHASVAAQSLHAAILLGALLPQMQEKTKAVRASLQVLKAVEDSIKAEQKHLRLAQEKQAAEQMRLALLLEEKAHLQNQKRQNLQEEEENRKKLAEKAQSLQDLLAEIAGQTPHPDGDSAGQMRIVTKFSTLRGLLPLPVAGRRLTGFGQKTGGKPAQGETVETAPAALVLAPAEGVVRYAGPFRSYGQVIILDAGENYYIILAGMAQIHVAPGQFLLQGEPVGNMENLLIANKGGLIMNKTAPKLYIEIRKDGKPVDPALWWVHGI